MPDIFITEEKSIPKDKTTLPQKASEKKSTKRILPAKPDDFDTRTLSAFRYYPDGTDFLNRDPEEEVVLLLRHHLITNIPWVFITTVMLFAPAVLNYFPILSFMPDRFQFLALIVWYLITVAYAFENFLAWFFNVNIVTDERLFDVNFSNLIYREMTDANIDKVQEVTVRMGSVIRTVFNYGDVIIQTAGENPRIVFEAVPNPDKVAKILRELRLEEELEAVEGRVR